MLCFTYLQNSGGSSTDFLRGFCSLFEGLQAALKQDSSISVFAAVPVQHVWDLLTSVSGTNLRLQTAKVSGIHIIKVLSPASNRMLSSSHCPVELLCRGARVRTRFSSCSVKKKGDGLKTDDRKTRATLNVSAAFYKDMVKPFLYFTWGRLKDLETVCANSLSHTVIKYLRLDLVCNWTWFFSSGQNVFKQKSSCTQDSQEVSGFQKPWKLR